MSASEPKHRGDLSALRIERQSESRSQRRSYGRYVGWAVVLVVLAISAYFVYRRWIAPRSYPEVETITVRPTSDAGSDTLLTASGYLVANKKADIGAKIPGRVMKLNFDVGSVVRRGDVLAVLDSEELRAQLSEGEASRAEAQREYERQRALWREGVASRALFDSADAQLKVASARVAQIETNLSNMTIRAPFDGTVVEKSTEIGQMVASASYGQLASGGSGATASIATIADLATLEVEADVNESNIGKLRIGQPATITVDAFPDRKWRGRLRQIVPTANRAKGVVQVKIEILDSHEGLFPEMSSTVTFLGSEPTAAQLSEKPKIRVPSTAVVHDAKGSYVVVVTTNRKTEFHHVTTGETRENRTEIVSGLKEGERVVTSDPGALKEHQAVRLADEESK